MTGIPLHNGRSIAQGIYGSAAIREQDLPAVKQLGVKTVISFCKPGELGFDEGRMFTGAGIGFVNIPMSDGDAPHQSPTDPNGPVKRFLDAISDPSRGPFLLHCAHGKGRTNIFGVLARARELQRQGDPQPFETALAEARRFGFGGGWSSGKQVKYARDAWNAYAAGLVPGYAACGPTARSA
jgi:hypothetical protein